jgi:hypothetical protein
VAFAALAAVILAFAGSASAKPAKPWTPVSLSRLDVTEGVLKPAGPNAILRTVSAGMRAVELDHGRHASRAQLRFRLLGDSETTKPLGSGIVRTQIGLKLRALDPCNLVYVMWRAKPDNAIVVYVKRNAGKATSADCGNGGYTNVAEVPLTGINPRASHLLDVRTYRTTTGSLLTLIRTDGKLLRRLDLDATLTAGLAGPVGVRSDNGDYRFRLSAGGR